MGYTVLYGTLCGSMVLWPHECVRRCLLQKAFEPYGAINNVHIVSGKRRACPLAAARHGPIALRARTRSYREELSLTVGLALPRYAKYALRTYLSPLDSRILLPGMRACVCACVCACVLACWWLRASLVRGTHGSVKATIGRRARVLGH
jgi:hypothetical protein